MRLLRRIDEAIGRFNRWFGATGVATTVQPQNRGPAVNATAVKISLGEIEQATADEMETPREAEEGESTRR